MSGDIGLVGSRELARQLKALGLTPVAFARLDGAPKPVLRIGLKGLRWSAAAVSYWIGERLEEARREAARQAAPGAVS